MGNVISSVNSTFQRIGTSYMEYTKKFHSYWYECPSYPLIENIVNGVILVPCKCLLVLPIAVVKILLKIKLYKQKNCTERYILGKPDLESNVQNNEQGGSYEL